jgi:hypothetical protein
MRVVLVSLRAGQGLAEHSAPGLVTVYSIGGRVLFCESAECGEMLSGKLIRLAPGRPHRLEAKEDSRLLVTIVRPSDASAWIALAPQGRAIDLRRTLRERRHSTVFYAFDQLNRSSSSTTTIGSPYRHNWSNCPANCPGNMRAAVVTSFVSRLPVSRPRRQRSQRRSWPPATTRQSRDHKQMSYFLVPESAAERVSVGVLYARFYRHT